MPALLASDSSDSEPAGLLTDEEEDAGDWRLETVHDADYTQQPLVRTCQLHCCCYSFRWQWIAALQR